MRATLLTTVGTSLDDVPLLLSYADAWAVLECELNTPGSILYRAYNPNYVSRTDDLLRHLMHRVDVNTYHTLGNKRNKFPEPMLFPGEKPFKANSETKNFGAGAVSKEEAEARLAKLYTE